MSVCDVVERVSAIDLNTQRAASGEVHRRRRDIGEPRRVGTRERSDVQSNASLIAESHVCW
jgi:hypothetical protein